MVKYSKKRSKRVGRKKGYSKRRYSKKRYSKKRQKGGMMAATKETSTLGDGGTPEIYQCKFVFPSATNINGNSFNNDTEYTVKWVAGDAIDPMPFSFTYDHVKLMARLNPGDLALNIDTKENIKNIILSPDKMSIDIELRGQDREREALDGKTITCTMLNGETAEHLFDKMKDNLTYFSNDKHSLYVLENLITYEKPSKDDY